MQRSTLDCARSSPLFGVAPGDRWMDIRGGRESRFRPLKSP